MGILKRRLKAPAAETNLPAPQPVPAPCEPLAEKTNIPQDKPATESFFDRDYYLRQNVDVANAKVDPLEHYLAFGEREGRRPSPDFDPAFYAKRYADTLRGLGPLEHFALHGQKAGGVTSDEGFDYDWYKRVYLSPAATDADCRKHYQAENQHGLLQKHGNETLIALREHFIPDEYLELYPDVVGLDPWVHFVSAGHRERRHLSRWYRNGFGHIKRQALEIRKQGWALRGIDIALDRGDLSALDKLASSGCQVLPAFEDALMQLLKDVASEISSLVVVGALGIGGAERYAANIFRSLAAIHGIENVAILATEGEIGQGAQWLPAGAKVFAISNYLPGVDRPTRARFVRRFISIIQPRTTYCVNSRALWDAALHPKNAALQNYSRFFASLFCYDYDPKGNRVGYAAVEFWQCFDFFDTYLIDNEPFVQELIRQFSIPTSHRAKLRVVRSPVAVGKTPKPTVDRPMRVLWCGRLARQKLPFVVSRIAALCPNIYIDMYAAAGDTAAITLNLPSNVSIMPPYDPEKGAPFDEYGAFLYTSLWDGIPTVMLDAASSGIPIIGSVVGGIGEVLTDQTGWPVSDPNDPQQYVNGLLEALFDPAEAERRAQEMLRRLEDHHSWNGFDANVRHIEHGA